MIATDVSILVGDIARGDISDSALTAAKGRLLHAFAVSLSAADLPVAQMAINSVRSGSGDCTVFGVPSKYSPDSAAFVNGTIGHASLREDAGPGGLLEGSHPSTYVIPAAMAIAEHDEVPGLQVLRGVVAGYEAASYIGRLAPRSILRRGFRPLGIMGPLGSAAAVAATLLCPDEVTRRALDIATNMAAGPTQGILEGTMEPYFQAGLGARGGILAVQIAQAGAITSEASLEGDFGLFRTYGGDEMYGLETETDQTGMAVERIATKNFAACLQNQGTIDLIRRTWPRGFRLHDLVAVRIRRPTAGPNGLNSPGVSREAPFANMLQAQMSARFTAAAALLDRAVNVPQFYAECFSDRDVVALATRIELQAVAAADDEVQVDVQLRDGRALTAGPEAPAAYHPTYVDLRQQFLELCAPLLGDVRARTVVQMIDELERAPGIRPLTALLAGTKSTSAK